MNQKEINKILEKHRLWLTDDAGGERAILKNANLRNAILRNADLSYADLSYADLRNADLRYADLSYANLRNAILKNANLRNAILRNADLRDADLWNADLIHIVAPIWNIYINRETTTIGDETHKNEEWRDFNDARIAKMDREALWWWKIHKQMVLAAMDAVNAQTKEDENEHER